MSNKNLLGLKVTHKVFMSGTITAFDGVHMTVDFQTKTCKFLYPDAFSSFLTAEDSEIQNSILNEIAQAKSFEQKIKELEEEKRKKAEDAKREELRRKSEIMRQSSACRTHTRSIRTNGKPMTFFVFQGSTFTAEYQGGYIWAPRFTASGKTCHHWERLLDVRKNDIILHGANGHIEAISIAKGPCYDAESPTELQKEQLWALDGRRVDCEYIKIRNPIKTANYKDTIIQYCNVKYAPFDKDGNGNMGYLFEINRELAKFFVELTSKANKYILDIDFVQDLLIK